MRPLTIQPRELEILREWAIARPEVLRCWVFGSRAGSSFRGRLPRPESDLDVAIELDCAPDEEGYIGLTYDAMPEWAARLEARLPYRVHLAELREEEPVARAIADGNAVLIFERV